MTETTLIHVLLIEDDARLAALTARYLESAGFAVEHVPDAPEAVRATKRRSFDVIVLDLGLPDRDGVDLCRDFRTRLDTPIIMLTARRDELDRIIGLDAGADDYITKPFSSRELVSRLRANVRRARGLVGPPRKLVILGPLTIDPSYREVTLRGNVIELSTYQFELLLALAERPGRVLSREQLLELARGTSEEAFDRSIDIQISKLRQKLGDDARRPRYLKTIRGSGYMLTWREEP